MKTKTLVFSTLFVAILLTLLVVFPMASSESQVINVPGTFHILQPQRPHVTQSDMTYTYGARGNYNAEFSKAVPSMKFEAGDASLEMTMLNIQPSEAVIRGPKITYFGAFDNTDVTYLTSSNKVKENIILKKKGTNEWHYLIDVENAEYAEGPEGNILFTNDEGEILFMIEKPYMQDSPRRMINYQGSRSNDVDLEIYEQDGNTYLKVTADEEWLNDAYYPVTVDPTVTLTTSNMSHSGGMGHYYGGKIIYGPWWCPAGKGWYSNPTFYSGTNYYSGTWIPPIGGYSYGGPGTTFCSYYYITSSWPTYITTNITYPKIHCSYQYGPYASYTTCTPGMATFWPTAHCPSTCAGYYGGTYYTTSYYTTGRGYCPGAGYGGTYVGYTYTNGYYYIPGSCSYGYGWAPYSSNVQTGPTVTYGYTGTGYSGTTYTGTYSTSYYYYFNNRAFIDFNVSGIPPSAEIQNVSLTMNVTARGDMTGSGIWINITELDQPSANYDLSNTTEWNMLWGDIGNGTPYAFTFAFNSTGTGTVTLNNAASVIHDAMGGSGVFPIGLRVLNEWNQYIFINSADTNLTITYDVQQPTATLSKSCPAYAMPGDNITCTITYKMRSAAASDVRIYETYPDNFTFLGADPAPDCGDTQWIIGDVAGGSTGTININLSISENLTIGSKHCNNVNMTYYDCIGNQSYTKKTQLCTILAEGAAGYDEKPWPSGGGGGIVSPPTWFRQYHDERTFTLGLGGTLIITDDTGKQTKVYVELIDDDTVWLVVTDPDELMLDIGETGTVDTNNNGMDDTQITLLSITNGKAELKFEIIDEVAPPPAPAEVPEVPPLPEEEPAPPAEEPAAPARPLPELPEMPDWGQPALIFGIVVVLALGVYFLVIRK